eukprot:968932-Rhodomonas_salina.1
MRGRRPRTTPPAQNCPAAPRPSCPSAFSPQQAAEKSLSTTQVVWRYAETARTATPPPMSTTGSVAPMEPGVVPRVAVSPSPSCPAWFRPA